MKSRESSQVNDKRSVPSSNDKGIYRQNHKGPSNSLNKTEDVYITSEHSYQRPQSSNQGGKPSRNTGERGVVPEGPNASLQMDAKKTLLDVSDRRTDEVRCNSPFYKVGTGGVEPKITKCTAAWYKLFITLHYAIVIFYILYSFVFPLKPKLAVIKGKIMYVACFSLVWRRGYVL